MDQYNLHWQIVLFSQKHLKKTTNYQTIAKAQVLTSVEQHKLFWEKVEQNRVEEEYEKNQMREREKKRAQKTKNKIKHY